MKVHCLKLKNKDLNKDIALFLISVIKKHISYFAYNDQLMYSPMSRPEYHKIKIELG